MSFVKKQIYSRYLNSTTNAHYSKLAKSGEIPCLSGTLHEEGKKKSTFNSSNLKKKLHSLIYHQMYGLQHVSFQKLSLFDFTIFASKTRRAYLSTFATPVNIRAISVLEPDLVIIGHLFELSERCKNVFCTAEHAEKSR